MTKVGETRRLMTSQSAVTSAFRTLADGVTLSIERLHKLLVFALERESKSKYPSNQEQLLISQLYATLRATVEATIYLNDELLTWCVTRILKLERTSGMSSKYVLSILKIHAPIKVISNTARTVVIVMKTHSR